MIFQVGMTYGTHTATHRTNCFVTFDGATRKKITINKDGIKQVTLDGEIITPYTSPIVTESAEVTAPDTHTWIEPSPNPIISPKPVSGALDKEPIIVIDITNQQWHLLDADTQNCLFEAVEHREIGTLPRTRTMPLKEVQALYGWGKCKYTCPLVDSDDMPVTEVHCGDARFGFALAEPILAERESDADIGLDFERERIERMWDRDCDRAANFDLT